MLSMFLCYNFYIDGNIPFWVLKYLFIFVQDIVCGMCLCAQMLPRITNADEEVMKNSDLLHIKVKNVITLSVYFQIQQT